MALVITICVVVAGAIGIAVLSYAFEHLRPGMSFKKEKNIDKAYDLDVLKRRQR